MRSIANHSHRRAVSIDGPTLEITNACPLSGLCNPRTPRAFVPLHHDGRPFRKQPQLRDQAAGRTDRAPGPPRCRQVVPRSEGDSDDARSATPSARARFDVEDLYGSSLELPPRPRAPCHKRALCHEATPGARPDARVRRSQVASKKDEPRALAFSTHGDPANCSAGARGRAQPEVEA